MKKRKKTLLIFVSVFIFFVVFSLIYFPFEQAPLALTLATGIGIEDLQKRVNQMERKAIKKEPFSKEDKAFLKALYTCFAKGARLTYVLRQSADMMERYLSCTGEPLKTKPRIFLNSAKVQQKMRILQRKATADFKKNGNFRPQYASGIFYMADRSCMDSLIGLYWGKVTLRPERSNSGKFVLNWRFELPWKWPAYESLKKKYGSYHAENFPIPNVRSIIQGGRFSLHIDNGLGEYLSRLGLAKPFLAFSELNEDVFNDE